MYFAFPGSVHYVSTPVGIRILATYCETGVLSNQLKDDQNGSVYKELLWLSCFHEYC